MWCYFHTSEIEGKEIDIYVHSNAVIYVQLVASNFSIKVLQKEELSFIICTTNAHHLQKVIVLELLIYMKVTTRYFVDFRVMEGRKSGTVLLSNCAVQSMDHSPLQDLLTFCDWNMNISLKLILYFKRKSKGFCVSKGWP